jgi:predicted amidohydrolase
MTADVRIGAVQARTRLVDYHVDDLEEALTGAEENLRIIVAALERAGAAGCAVVALTEDTLGLHKWLAAHPDLGAAALTRMVPRMLEDLGAVAAGQSMAVICCSDQVEHGDIYNTAFLLGEDGHEIGRYRKINLPYSELGTRRRGSGYPVYEAGRVGPVGMLICYDMVFPEPSRCLALNGAGTVFVPTMGVASVGEGDLGRLGFRMRAADNLVYLVVAFRHAGSMVISPRGTVLAEGDEELVAADVDPYGGRAGGNAFDWHTDLRTRLFRERAPESYGVLCDAAAPVLRNLPDPSTPLQVTQRADAVLTQGEDAFHAAEELREAGHTEEAIQAFQQLCATYAGSWIERRARELLADLRQ